MRPSYRHTSLLKALRSFGYARFSRLVWRQDDSPEISNWLFAGPYGYAPSLGLGQHQNDSGILQSNFWDKAIVFREVNNALYLTRALC